MPVSGRWHAIDVVEGVHKCRSTCIERGLERRQIGFPQSAVAHFHGIVIAATDGCTIRRKMFRARHDGIEVAKFLALETFDAGVSNSRTQIRVFAGAFHDAAPTRIARNVHHRGKRPMDAT